jgi:hypothetical protein
VGQPSPFEIVGAVIVANLLTAVLIYAEKRLADGGFAKAFVGLIGISLCGLVIWRIYGWRHGLSTEFNSLDRLAAALVGNGLTFVAMYSMKELRSQPAAAVFGLVMCAGFVALGFLI